MRIGVYVGSFSPVHKGHIAIAREILAQDLVDEVLIIPTGAYWDKNDLLPFKERTAMLKLYEKDGIRIGEEYGHYPYTHEIFKKLTEDYPQAKLYLILGADNIVSFDKWKEYEYLLQFPFIIIRRNELGDQQIREYMHKLGKRNYELLDMGLIDISSTYIRDNLDDYEKVKDMIDKEVYDYLIAKGKNNAA